MSKIAQRSFFGVLLLVSVCSLGWMVNGAFSQEGSRHKGSALRARGVCPAGMIDDLDVPENGAIPKCEGRSGHWYNFHDEGNQTLQEFQLSATPGVGGHGHAVRCSGACENAMRTDKIWGAGFGFDLNNPNNDPKGKQPYDAVGRGYHGIRFKARLGETKTANTVVSVRFPDINTDPVGGRCKTCWDDYSYSVNLSSVWRTYTIYWRDLVHVGNGVPNQPFAENAILSVHWRYLPSDTYDILVDDVEFVR